MTNLTPEQYVAACLKKINPKTIYYNGINNAIQSQSKIVLILENQDKLNNFKHCNVPNQKFRSFLRFQFKEKISSLNNIKKNTTKQEIRRLFPMVDMKEPSKTKPTSQRGSRSQSVNSSIDYIKLLKFLDPEIKYVSNTTYNPFVVSILCDLYHDFRSKTEGKNTTDLTKLDETEDYLCNEFGYFNESTEFSKLWEKGHKQDRFIRESTIRTKLINMYGLECKNFKSDKYSTLIKNVNASIKNRQSIIGTEIVVDINTRNKFAVDALLDYDKKITTRDSQYCSLDAAPGCKLDKSKKSLKEQFTIGDFIKIYIKTNNEGIASIQKLCIKSKHYDKFITIFEYNDDDEKTYNNASQKCVYLENNKPCITISEAFKKNKLFSVNAVKHNFKKPFVFTEGENENNKLKFLKKHIISKAKSVQQIKSALKSTNWGNKEVLSLFLKKYVGDLSNSLDIYKNTTDKSDLNFLTNDFIAAYMNATMNGRSILSSGRSIYLINRKSETQHISVNINNQKSNIPTLMIKSQTEQNSSQKNQKSTRLPNLGSTLLPRL